MPAAGPRWPCGALLAVPTLLVRLHADRIRVDVDVDATLAQTPAPEADTSFLVADTSFLVKQYNVLAGYLGSNLQPWFLNGINVSASRQQQILDAYNTPRDRSGRYPYTFENGWGGLVSDDELQMLRAVDDKFFSWPARRERLLLEMLRDDPAVLTLSELDDTAFFRPALAKHGYTGVWTKRPGRSKDGCGIFWKRARFSFIASESLDFVDPANVAIKVPTTKQAWYAADLDRQVSRLRASRIAVVAAIRDRQVGRNILVATAHLMRNPDDRKNELLRHAELFQMVSLIKTFARKRGLDIAFDGSATASRDAVLLTGDFNSARSPTKRAALGVQIDPGEPGLTRDVDLLANSRMSTAFPFGELMHDDECTTLTQWRRMWIDYIFFSCNSLNHLAALKDPCPGSPIPDASHPSDHLPVAARFAWQPHPNGAEICQPVDLLTPFCDPAPMSML